MALGYLGWLYHTRSEDVEAQRIFDQELKVAEEVYGQDSRQMVPVLETLAHFYADRNDFLNAEAFAKDELKLVQKNAGSDNLSYSRGSWLWGLCI